MEYLNTYVGYTGKVAGNGLMTYGMDQINKRNEKTENWLYSLIDPFIGGFW